MIRRLRVRGYKSLADCQIDFGPVTVILGPNGAGKSNLLDLVGLLSRLASRETVREAFAEHRGLPLEAFHWTRGFGPAGYKELLGRERLAFSVECDLDLHPRIVEHVNRTLAEREQAVGADATYTKVVETKLRYALEITLHPRSGELFVTDESLRALRKDKDSPPQAKASRAPFFEREGGDGGKARFVARVERQGHPRYFEANRPRTLLSELSDPVYHPHVVAAAREISSWRVYYVEPARMRERIGVQSAEEPGRSGELLAAYYYTLQERSPETLRAIVRNLRDLVPGFEGLRVDVREGSLEIVTTNVGGAEYPARLLSEGTLRLLCLLGIAVAPSPPGVAVYEEPENGVNPARLDLLADVIRSAVEVRPDPIQFVLTTHSPLVCNLFPQHLVLCSWSPDGGTALKPFPWNREALYFQDEVVRGLDGVSTLPEAGGSLRVAE